MNHNDLLSRPGPFGSRNAPPDPSAFPSMLAGFRCWFPEVSGGSVSADLCGGSGICAWREVMYCFAGLSDAMNGRDRNTRPERSAHGAAGAVGRGPASTGAGRGRYGREHGARQRHLPGPPPVTRRAAPREPKRVWAAPAEMRRSVSLRAGPARLRGIASAR